MPSSDYYEVLGLTKSATADEIRKAYRKLSRTYHPDAKKDDPEAAKRFQEIQEAHDVLGDEEKRKKYDRFGPNFAQMDPTGGRGAPHGQPWPGGGAGPGAGGFDFQDLFGGVDLGDMFGGGRGGPRGARRAPPKGEDIRATLKVPFETAARGGSQDIRLDRGGKIETLGVKIPAGIADGGVMRLAGQGEPSFRGGPPGDLLLTIQVQPHAWFRREGNNLLLDVPLTPAEAALGTKVEVPTLTEGKVTLTVPPGTSSGMKLRLRGKGIVDPQSHQTGDQFVVVKIAVPKELSPEQKTLYESLQQLDPSPRAGLW